MSSNALEKGAGIPDVIHTLTVLNRRAALMGQSVEEKEQNHPQGHRRKSEGKGVSQNKWKTSREAERPHPGTTWGGVQMAMWWIQKVAEHIT